MKKSFFKALSVLLLLLCTNISKGQWGLPTVLLGGKVIKDIIAEFESSANRLMQDAQGTGNALIARFGNELNVATQNINYYFGKNTDKIYYDKLKPAEQILLGELNKIIDAFNNTQSNLLSISELTNLDLIELTNRINFLTSKIDYYISSIHGTTLTNSTADYKIVVTGLGFGFSSSNKDYQTSVYVNGILLPVTSIDFSKRRQMSITIPNSFLREMFDPDEITFVKVKVVNQIRKSVGWIFKRSALSEYETDFNLTLMPAVAGFVVLRQTLTDEILGPKEEFRLISRSFKSCTTKNPCIYNEEWTCPENQRITRVEYQCSGQCGWSYPLHSSVKGYGVDYERSNNNKTVNLYRYIDGNNQTTINHYVYYKTLINYYRTIVSDTVYLGYGDLFDIILDEKNIEGNFSLQGQLKTGQLLVTNNNTIKNNKYLQLEGMGKEAGRFKITLRLKEPY